MTNTKKIIIFLTPISKSVNRNHRGELVTNYCLLNNFTILKIIEQSSFNYSMLRKLIEQIRCEPKITVTILIEDKLLNTPNSIVLFSVLGILYLLGLN